jgi:hypothetical protein
VTDWRLPENRIESFHRFYEHHLRYRSHPGCVYAMLPGIATALDLDEDGRAWLVWLNGNTQNAVTSLLLLEAAPRPQDWRAAVDFWNDNFKQLEWDTDRRHQKSKFGEATEAWATRRVLPPAEAWLKAAAGGWPTTWRFAFEQPYMGRLSAWSMTEYARILLGPQIPDAANFMLEDKSGSCSHRNGLGLLAGYDSTYWGAGDADMLGMVGELDQLGEWVLTEARRRNFGQPWETDVTRLTMESALCTFKSWRKPNRRYPNVYSDMFYYRIKKAEARFGRSLDLLWDIRKQHLPERLRLEDNPYDPGLSPVKQNWFRETGEIPMIFVDYPEMKSGFDHKVELGVYGVRKDPSWT